MRPLAAVLCLGVWPVWPQTTELVLGVGEVGGPGYRTIRIQPRGKTVEILSTRGLLVPHGSGFLRVGTDRVATKGEPPDPDLPRFARSPSAYETSEERLWVEPAETRHKPKLKADEAIVSWDTETCRDTEIEITFVSREYLSYTENSIINCGVHPDGQFQWNVVRLNAWAGPRLSILTVIGESVRQPFVDGVNHAECDREKEVDFRNWAIVRGKGQWMLRGYVVTHRLCGYCEEFDLPDPWQKVESEIPDLEDAFASPQGDLLVALTKNEVLVYRQGRQILRHTRPAAERGKVVMAEWR